jgi:hypothetical protein
MWSVRTGSPNCKVKEYRAASWSWVSQSGQIQYIRNIGLWDLENSAVEIEEVGMGFKGPWNDEKYKLRIPKSLMDTRKKISMGRWREAS